MLTDFYDELSGSGRSMYKNVLSTSSTPAATAPPPEILPGLTSFIPQKNSGFMVPNAGNIIF